MLLKEGASRSHRACMLFNSESSLLPCSNSSRRPSSCSAPSLSADNNGLGSPGSAVARPGPPTPASGLKAAKGLGPANRPGGAGVPVVWLSSVVLTPLPTVAVLVDFFPGFDAFNCW